MKANKVLRLSLLASFLGAAVAGLAALDRGSALAAAGARDASAVRLSSHPECELPTPGLAGLAPTFIQPGSGGTIPLAGVEAGDPELIVTCMSLDREYYFEDMDFVATVVVQNFGGAQPLQHARK